MLLSDNSTPSLSGLVLPFLLSIVSSLCFIRRRTLSIVNYRPLFYPFTLCRMQTNDFCLSPSHSFRPCLSLILSLTLRAYHTYTYYRYLHESHCLFDPLNPGTNRCREIGSNVRTSCHNKRESGRTRETSAHPKIPPPSECWPSAKQNLHWSPLSIQSIFLSISLEGCSLQLEYRRRVLLQARGPLRRR